MKTREAKLLLVVILLAIFCLIEWREASKANESLEYIYQEGVKDPALRPVLERIDQKRAAYWEALRPERGER